MYLFKSCIIHFQRNLFNKHFSEEIYTLAKSIITAPSFESVESILNTIKSLDEAGAKDWANYYETPWIISSLNINMSKMEHQIWRKYENNTNAAEAAHALVNKSGKQLKLLTAILNGKRHDERLLKIQEVHDFSGIPYTRRDKSDVKKQQTAINRKATKLNKSGSKISRKRKISSTNVKEKREKRLRQNNLQVTNVIEIESDNDPQDIKNEIQAESFGNMLTNEINKEPILNIELEERKMALLERQAKLRKELAEAEAIELQNRQLKINLGLPL
ncbi:cobalamin biosynthesis protein cobt [Gigaspora margarita]|uniref:Cobalamin biosynthesis protein cobt n=1 Tax=Gigaspora margarita TaxID=4874 RepID=A0A8H4AAF7_GIGMA|nr:cobalamin biosynthesis protein cobt [Gigaspora margarita]